MRKKCFPIVAGTLIFLSIFGGAFGQTYERNEYLEDSGSRILVTENEKIDHTGFAGSAFVAASYVRMKADGDEFIESYSFHIEVFSDDGFEMFTADSANFIIDNETAQYKLFVSAAERREESNFESGFIQLNKSDFEKIRAATDLRFRIHNNDYTVTQNAKHAFFLVLNTLKE